MLLLLMAAAALEWTPPSPRRAMPMVVLPPASSAARRTLIIRPPSPRSHLHGAVASNRIIEVLDVPCHVTDGQLVDAMAEHADSNTGTGKGSGGGILTVFSTTVGDHQSAAGSTSTSVGTYRDLKRREDGGGGGGGGSGSGGGGEDFLDRTCFVVMESEAARVSAKKGHLVVQYI